MNYRSVPDNIVTATSALCYASLSSLSMYSTLSVHPQRVPSQSERNYSCPMRKQKVRRHFSIRAAMDLLMSSALFDSNEPDASLAASIALRSAWSTLIIQLRQLRANASVKTKYHPHCVAEEYMHLLNIAAKRPASAVIATLRGRVSARQGKTRLQSISTAADLAPAAKGKYVVGKAKWRDITPARSRKTWLN